MSKFMDDYRLECDVRKRLAHLLESIMKKYNPKGYATGKAAESANSVSDLVIKNYIKALPLIKPAKPGYAGRRSTDKAQYYRSKHITRKIAYENKRREMGLIKGKELARLAGQFFDEHAGWDARRGDYLNTSVLDYVWPDDAAKPPYLDMGGEGLALISITRTRVYSRQYTSRFGKGSPVETTYLVGKNEVGTYFAHPVPNTYTSVARAVDWIWSGHEPLKRQGDIALVKALGPKLPSSLPQGHRVNCTQILHDTHPPIPLPSKGERIIVGRRAIARVSEATRD